MKLVEENPTPSRFIYFTHVDELAYTQYLLMSCYVVMKISILKYECSINQFIRGLSVIFSIIMLHLYYFSRMKVIFLVCLSAWVALKLAPKNLKFIWTYVVFVACFRLHSGFANYLYFHVQLFTLFYVTFGSRQSEVLTSWVQAFMIIYSFNYTSFSCRYFPVVFGAIYSNILFGTTISDLVYVISSIGFALTHFYGIDIFSLCGGIFNCT